MNNVKIIISGIIAAAVVSLLYTVIPVTDAFIISHIFTLIAISGICTSLCLFGKSNNIVGMGYIYSASIYAVLEVITSVIACIIPFSGMWTFVIHTAILAVFAIIIIATSTTDNYIKRLDKKADEKHREFLKEKENYWK